MTSHTDVSPEPTTRQPKNRSFLMVLDSNRMTTKGVHPLERGSMFSLIRRVLGRSTVAAVLLVVACTAAHAAGAAVPAPAVDAPAATTHSKQTAVLAGGCFWG